MGGQRCFDCYFKMANTIIDRKKKRWENSAAEVNEIISKISGKRMGTNIVVRAFYITKTNYKYSRVIKLKSSEFCVEAVITTDLPK